MEETQDIATQGVSCVEHTECLAWNTGSVLLGTQGMSCVEHRKGSAWNTGNLLSVEHRTGFVCNTGNLVFGAQEIVRGEGGWEGLALRVRPAVEGGLRREVRKLPHTGPQGVGGYRLLPRHRGQQ